MVTKPIHPGNLVRSSDRHRFSCLRQHGLFFAGEATHADWYGYMQGGYFSGLDRAKEIASCVQGKKCDSYQPSTSLPVIIKAQECKSKASRKKGLTVSLLAALIFIAYNAFIDLGFA